MDKKMFENRQRYLLHRHYFPLQRDLTLPLNKL